MIPAPQCRAEVCLDGMLHHCLQPQGHDGWHSVGLLGDAPTPVERPVVLLRWESAA